MQFARIREYAYAVNANSMQVVTSVHAPVVMLPSMTFSGNLQSVLPALMMCAHVLLSVCDPTTPRSPL